MTVNEAYKYIYKKNAQNSLEKNRILAEI